jgi:uncharacterized membrane protein YidH (DUF202 family)
MKLFQLLARAVFSVISLVLMILAGGLIVYAGMQLWEVFWAPESDIGSALLNAVGYMVIAIAVFEVAKYILEEEVLDPTEMRHTGEARRSMTKFISTIAIAVFLEALVTVFAASKERQMEQMLYPTLLLFGGIALVVGLGVYQRLSVSAERESEDPPEEQKDPDLP